MIGYAAFCELSQDQSAGTAAAEGDFGFKVLTSSDSAELEKKLAAEIANGRLAMMAIIGMFFQDGLTGCRGAEELKSGSKRASNTGCSKMQSWLVSPSDWDQWSRQYVGEGCRSWQLAQVVPGATGPATRPLR